MRLACLTPSALTFLTIAALASPVEADIYRRTDADGVVQITNVPRGKGWVLVVDEEEAEEAAPAPATGSKARRKAKYAPFLREAARTYALPEELIRAVIDVESAWNPRAVSHAGAMGLMQLMPATVKSMGVQNVYDPRENILGGTRLLRILANQFAGDLVLTLAAYNAGAGIVSRRMGVPYERTRGYVQSVMRRYRAYQRQ
jgi:soluble lytic murein transglycosylase-like protein